MLDEKGMQHGITVTGVIKLLVNAKGLNLECTEILHEVCCY